MRESKYNVSYYFIQISKNVIIYKTVVIKSEIVLFSLGCVVAMRWNIKNVQVV